MMAQIPLVSAQVQTKSGVRVLQAVTFEVFSRIEFATASVVNGTRNAWGNYVGLRGVKAENDSLTAAASHDQLLESIDVPQAEPALT